MAFRVEIESDEEQDRLAELYLQVTAQSDLSPEEQRLAKLLHRLIEEYELRQQAQRPKPKPLEMLEALMEMGDLRQADLAGVFGSQANVSRILSGERQINLSHARRLAARFRMPLETFLQ